MAVINQVDSFYNSNLKKMGSKLTFHLGEVFSAKVVKQIGQSELVLKLTDGWQFHGKLDKPLNFTPQGFIKLQVVGYEDGKLTIKLIDTLDQKQPTLEGSLENILLRNNMDIDERIILEKMINHNMTLTREKISSVKSLIDFINKIKSDPQEEDTFISKYLLGKNLISSSDIGKTITNNLKDFFRELKSINIDDLLTLIENDIELNTENIDSFKRIFKESGGLFRLSKGLEEELAKISIQKNANNIDGLGKNGPKEQGNILGNRQQLAETGSWDNSDSTVFTSKSFISENNKSINKDTISSKNYGTIIINNKSVLVNLGDKISDISSFNDKNNQDLEEAKKQSVTESTDVKFILKDIIVRNQSIINISDLNKQINTVDGLKDKDLFNSIKDVLKNTPEFASVDINDLLNENNANTIKKVVNQAVNMLLQSKVDINEKEIFVLLKSMAKYVNIDKKAAQVESLDKETNMVSIDDIVMKEIEGKKDNSEVAWLSKNEVDNLSEKKTSQLIKENIESKTIQIKNIIKDLISTKNQMGPDIFDKVFQVIKTSLNDIKVFNSVSNQYYYMDLPIKLKDKEYPCKIIIKDDRKNGKRIDSKNIKMVLSIKTINMGVVDGFIKVKDLNMNIDIKCEEQWLKILKLGSEKLIKGLDDSGYNLYLNIEKSEDEINLSTCRDFFNDNNFSNIDIKV